MVLEMMGKQKELLTTIKTWKFEYIGHIMRNNKRLYSNLYITWKDRKRRKKKCRKTNILAEESP